MNKNLLSEEEADKLAHLNLAKALESLDLAEHKTEKIKIQMAVLALVGLAFELGFEKVVHKALGDVARAMHNMKDMFIDKKHNVVAEALQLAKRKDRTILSKFLKLQEKEKGRDLLVDFLNEHTGNKMDANEICDLILEFLNKNQFLISPEQNN